MRQSNVFEQSQSSAFQAQAAAFQRSPFDLVNAQAFDSSSSSSKTNSSTAQLTDHKNMNEWDTVAEPAGEQLQQLNEAIASERPAGFSISGAWNQLKNAASHTVSKGTSAITSGAKKATETIAKGATSTVGTVDRIKDKTIDQAAKTVKSTQKQAADVLNTADQLKGGAVEQVRDAASGATQKADEIKDSVVDKASIAVDKVDHWADRTVEQVSNGASEVIDRADDLKNTAVDLVESGREVASEMIGAADNIADRAIDKTQDIWQTGSDVASDAFDLAQEGWQDTSEFATRHKDSFISQAGHTVLDGLGMVPVVGAVADGLNAAWYLAEGNTLEAGLSAVGMIPVIGELGVAGKLAVKGGGLLVDGAKMARGANRVDNALVQSGRVMGIAGIPLGAQGAVTEFSEAGRQFAQGNYLQSGLSIANGTLAALGVGSGARGIKPRSGSAPDVSASGNTQPLTPIGMPVAGTTQPLTQPIVGGDTQPLTQIGIPVSGATQPLTQLSITSIDRTQPFTQPHVAIGSNTQPPTQLLTQPEIPASSTIRLETGAPLNTPSGTAQLPQIAADLGVPVQSNGGNSANFTPRSESELQIYADLSGNIVDQNGNTLLVSAEPTVPADGKLRPEVTMSTAQFHNDLYAAIPEMARSPQLVMAGGVNGAHSNGGWMQSNLTPARASVGSSGGSQSSGSSGSSSFTPAPQQPSGSFSGGLGGSDGQSGGANSLLLLPSGGISTNNPNNSKPEEQLGETPGETAVIENLIRRDSRFSDVPPERWRDAKVRRALDDLRKWEQDVSALPSEQRAVTQIFDQEQTMASRADRALNEPGNEFGMEVLSPEQNQNIPLNFQVGNYAHEYAERLIPDFPLGLDAERTIKLGGGREGRADGVDWRNFVVVETKTDNPEEIAKGQQQVGRYVTALQRLYPPSQGKWTGKVYTYNYQEALADMLDRGHLPGSIATRILNQPKGRAFEVTKAKGGRAGVASEISLGDLRS